MRRKTMGIEMPTVRAIYAAYEAERGERRHNYNMSAGTIGGNCERFIWLSFRWVFEPGKFDGKKLRLFASGHREEDRVIADLRRAGFSVWDKDPDTGQQFKMSSHGGHFVGKIDGVVKGIPEAPETAHLLEIKTHNRKSFDALEAKGVAASKPEHVAQMQAYMQAMGLHRALYVAVCKDSDAIYVERVPSCNIEFARINARVERVLTTDSPPHREYSSVKGPPCLFCAAKPFCHDRLWPLRNCRTCLHSTPEQDGASRWVCALQQRDLSIDEQKSGCGQHLYIPALVPGEQIDADVLAGRVTYRINGEEWTDGPIILDDLGQGDGP